MPDSVSFYISPHQDDWQLFYGHQAYKDLLDSKVKVVLICITAGDAGLTDGWWEVREQGTLASIQSTCLQEKLFTEKIEVNQYQISKYILGNTVNYCLRLPDGLPDGSGSSASNFQTLKSLYDKNLPLVAKDNSAIYYSWNEFCHTLSRIIEIESQNFSPSLIWIHAPDYSSKINPHDHSDHIVTAQAIRSITGQNYNRCWWLTYYSYYCPINLSEKDIQNKQTLFSAYQTKVEQLRSEDQLSKMHILEWNCWGNKGYKRTTLHGDLDINDPFFHVGCPQLENFKIDHLFDENAILRRCVLSKEMRSDFLQVTNLMTQQTVMLNLTAEVLWHLLIHPHSIKELRQILNDAFPQLSVEENNKSLHDLLTALLSAKLIFSTSF